MVTTIAAAEAARAVSMTIPIVMSGLNDPVGAGLAASGDNQSTTRVSNFLYGDALDSMSGSAKGGDDKLIGGNNLSSLEPNFQALEQRLYGDTFTMNDAAKGGNDTLTGGDNLTGGRIVQDLYGDAAQMNDSAKGGNDTLIGGDNFGIGVIQQFLSGNAGQMHDTAIGGNDTIIGGDNFGLGGVGNTLFGDASESMNDSAKGGNDTLIGGSNYGSSGLVGNLLYGDAPTASATSIAGNDRLISGTNATDIMWGDASNLSVGGRDTFVFAGAFGEDEVRDFRRADGDRIEINVASVTSFSDLNITQDAGNAIIKTSASATDSITLIGVTDPLTASDFIFV